MLTFLEEVVGAPPKPNRSNVSSVGVSTMVESYSIDLQMSSLLDVLRTLAKFFLFFAIVYAELLRSHVESNIWRRACIGP